MSLCVVTRFRHEHRLGHVRRMNAVHPYIELTGDLANNTVADYNFVTLNLCNDMHNDGCGKQGDIWLSNEFPKIIG